MPFWSPHITSLFFHPPRLFKVYFFKRASLKTKNDFRCLTLTQIVGVKSACFESEPKRNACPKLPECLVFSMTPHRCAGNCWKAFLLAQNTSRFPKISLLKMLHNPIVILTHPAWPEGFQKEVEGWRKLKGPAGPSKMTSPTWCDLLEVSTFISIGNTSTQLIHDPFSSYVSSLQFTNKWLAITETWHKEKGEGKNTDNFSDLLDGELEVWKLLLGGWRVHVVACCVSAIWFIPWNWPGNAVKKGSFAHPNEGKVHLLYNLENVTIVSFFRGYTYTHLLFVLEGKKTSS